MYTRLYDNLDVMVMDERQHAQSCNYWYAVTNGATSHTAFETKRGLTRWLKERGLELTETLTAPPAFSWQRIRGAYREVAHMDINEFNALQPIITTRTVSNGDYVVAKITLDQDGIRTVHTLNPNVKRKVFNYRTSSRMMR